MTDTASRTAGRTRGPDAASPRPASGHQGRRRIRRFLNDQGDWILVGLSVVFLVAFAWPILNPHLNPNMRRVCEIAQWGAWAGFGLDYFARLWVALDRQRYFTRHLLDLAIVVLPVLGPLRLARLLVLFRIVNRKAAASMRGNVALYVTISAGALVFLASLAVLNAERQAPASMHANILSIGTALW
jgi:voltage-gated potassium channel